LHAFFDLVFGDGKNVLFAAEESFSLLKDLLTPPVGLNQWGRAHDYVLIDELKNQQLFDAVAVAMLNNCIDTQVAFRGFRAFAKQVASACFFVDDFATSRYFEPLGSSRVYFTFTHDYMRTIARIR